MAKIWHGFTYDPNKKRWFKANGLQVTLGKQIKTSDGKYYLLNSDGTITYAGSVSGGVDLNFVNTQKKYKRNVDTTLLDRSMRSGLIGSKQGWRFDTNAKNIKIKEVNGRRYYLAPSTYDGKNTWFSFDSGLNIALDKVQLLKLIEQKKNKILGRSNGTGWWDSIKNDGIAAGAINHVLDSANINNLWLRSAVNLGSLGLYMLPGVGQALSLADAGLAAARGDWGNAALNLAFMVPGARFLKGAKTLSKVPMLSKLGKVFGGSGATRLEKMQINAIKSSLPKYAKVQNKTILSHIRNKSYAWTPNVTKKVLSQADPYLHTSVKNLFGFTKGNNKFFNATFNPNTTGFGGNVKRALGYALPAALIGGGAYGFYRDKQAENEANTWYQNNQKQDIEKNHSAYVLGRMSDDEIKRFLIDSHLMTQEDVSKLTPLQISDFKNLVLNNEI